VGTFLEAYDSHQCSNMCSMAHVLVKLNLKDGLA